MSDVPTTLDGEDLDSYCNTIDMALQELLFPLSEFPENHPSGKAFDPNTIPSPVQREGFELMRLLLSCAESLSGSLRYDVCVSHEKCPHHDEHMARQIVRLKQTINGTKENV